MFNAIAKALSIRDGSKVRKVSIDDGYTANAMSRPIVV